MARRQNGYTAPPAECMSLDKSCHSKRSQPPVDPTCCLGEWLKQRVRFKIGCPNCCIRLMEEPKKNPMDLKTQTHLPTFLACSGSFSDRVGATLGASSAPCTQSAAEEIPKPHKKHVPIGATVSNHIPSAGCFLETFGQTYRHKKAYIPYPYQIRVSERK